MSVTWTQFKLRNEKSKNLSVVHPDFQVSINGDILRFHIILTSIVSHLACEILLVTPHPQKVKQLKPRHPSSSKSFIAVPLFTNFVNLFRDKMVNRVESNAILGLRQKSFIISRAFRQFWVLTKWFSLFFQQKIPTFDFFQPVFYHFGGQHS